MTVLKDAGILGADDELTSGARTNFIQNVKDELEFGSEKAPPSPFPCGPSIPPMPFARLLDLENESKFPGFHANVLGQYRDIARALDSASRFTLLPICDPSALAVALDVEPPELEFPSEFLTIGFNPALLASTLGFKLPTDLLSKLPPLLSLPIPDLKIAPAGIDAVKFPDLLSFSSALNGVPPKLINVVLELLTKMPQLITDVLSFKLDAFCEAVANAQLFGSFGPTATTWLAAQKVLVRKVAEMVLLNTVGTTMGSSPVGIVGGLGAFLGYRTN